MGKEQDVAAIAKRMVRSGGLWMIATQTRPAHLFDKSWWHMITPSDAAFTHAQGLGLIEPCAGKWRLTLLGEQVQAHLQSERQS